MKTLKEIALSHGMEVPLYTATGWGNAAIIPQEVIPVTAAYTYPTWADIGMSPFYLFRDIHTTPDYSPVRYEGYRYPSFCAEMGVGIQMTYGRRPRIPAEAGEGLMVRSLGSGANGIGYYMYHGGITPQGKGVSLVMNLQGCQRCLMIFKLLSENSDIRALLIIHYALFIIL